MPREAKNVTAVRRAGRFTLRQEKLADGYLYRLLSGNGDSGLKLPEDELFQLTELLDDVCDDIEDGKL
jgi:hypothetical protein